MENNKVKIIMEAFKSCNKDLYSREEDIEELYKLQDEMVEQAFGREEGSVERRTIKDVLEYYKELNLKCNNVATKELQKFENSTDVFLRILKTYQAGIKGEESTFLELQLLDSENTVIENIGIGKRKLCTEIDAIAITPKCITIVESKNYHGNVKIDTDGYIYKDGNRFFNVCENMKSKKKHIRAIIKKECGVEPKIQYIVVFTNPESVVKNEHSKLKTCMLEDLNSFIDNYEGDDLYSSEMIGKMKEAIRKNEYFGKYRSAFVAEQYKYEFAILKCKLEDAMKETNPKESSSQERSELSGELFNKKEGDIKQVSINAKNNMINEEKSDVNAIKESSEAVNRVCHIRIVLNSV